MNNFKTTLKKLLRIEDKHNPTSHQVNDREIMAVLNESNKEAISKVDKEEARLQAIADERQRIKEETLALKNKEAQEKAAEKARLDKVREKRISATQKFEVKRMKQLKKSQAKRLKNSSRR